MKPKAGAFGLGLDEDAHLAPREAARLGDSRDLRQRVRGETVGVEAGGRGRDGVGGNRAGSVRRPPGGDAAP